MVIMVTSWFAMEGSRVSHGLTTKLIQFCLCNSETHMSSNVTSQLAHD